MTLILLAFLKCGQNKYYTNNTCKTCPPYSTKLNYTIPDTQCDNITCTDGNSTWFPIDRISSIPQGEFYFSCRIMSFYFAFQSRKYFQSRLTVQPLPNLQKVEAGCYNVGPVVHAISPVIIFKGPLTKRLGHDLFGAALW